MTLGLKKAVTRGPSVSFQISNTDGLPITLLEKTGVSKILAVFRSLIF